MGNDVTRTIAAIDAKLAVLLERAQANNRRFFTIDSAAEYSDLSPASIRRMLAQGKLVGLRPVRGRVLIDRHQLDAVMLSSTAVPRTGRGKCK